MDILSIAGVATRGTYLATITREERGVVEAGSCRSNVLGNNEEGSKAERTSEELVPV